MADTNWNIPHDERHQFLVFGERDDNFYDWVNWFDKKGVKYEIGGGSDRWTIYKHMWYVEDYHTARINRCCPMMEDL